MPFQTKDLKNVTEISRFFGLKVAEKDIKCFIMGGLIWARV